MPRGLLTTATFLPRLALAFGAALLLGFAGASAAAATAQVNVEVPEGKTKSVRLRNLPEGTRVSVRVTTNGRLQVALISAIQLKSRRPEALFRGALSRSLSFSVVLPESSDYYLVLDNRRGTEPIKTRATIRAEKAPSTPDAPKERDDKPAGKLNETRAGAAPLA